MNLSQALEHLSAAATMGNADALSWLGYLYYQGENVPQNKTKALEYFQVRSLGFKGFRV